MQSKGENVMDILQTRQQRNILFYACYQYLSPQFISTCSKWRLLGDIHVHYIYIIVFFSYSAVTSSHPMSSIIQIMYYNCIYDNTL